MKIPPNKSLARTYGKLAMDAYIEHNYQSACVSFTIAINHDDTNPEYYMGRAVVSSHQEGYQEALIDINKAISLRPDVKTFYGVRALILGKMGKTEKAADEFKRVRIDPYNFALNFVLLLSRFEVEVRGRKDA